MCSSLLMQRPGLLTVNRDSRRNVELVARRLSGTWPRLVQNIVASGVALARPFWRLPQVWCHGPIHIRPISSCMGRCSPERMPRDRTGRTYLRTTGAVLVIRSRFASSASPALESRSDEVIRYGDGGGLGAGW